MSLVDELQRRIGVLEQQLEVARAQADMSRAEVLRMTEVLRAEKKDSAAWTAYEEVMTERDRLIEQRDQALELVHRLRCDVERLRGPP